MGKGLSLMNFSQKYDVSKGLLSECLVKSECYLSFYFVCPGIQEKIGDYYD